MIVVCNFGVMALVLITLVEMVRILSIIGLMSCCRMVLFTCLWMSLFREAGRLVIGVMLNVTVAVILLGARTCWILLVLGHLGTLSSAVLGSGVMMLGSMRCVLEWEGVMSGRLSLLTRVVVLG